jgi:hypothetical protein
MPPTGFGKTPLAAHVIVRALARGRRVVWLAREKRYAGGWAAHKVKETFGSWPNDWRVRTADSRPPSFATRKWVKSRSIAWAKRLATNG